MGIRRRGRNGRATYDDPRSAGAGEQSVADGLRRTPDQRRSRFPVNGKISRLMGQQKPTWQTTDQHGRSHDAAPERRQSPSLRHPAPRLTNSRTRRKPTVTGTSSTRLPVKRERITARLEGVETICSRSSSDAVMTAWSGKPTSEAEQRAIGHAVAVRQRFSALTVAPTSRRRSAITIGGGRSRRRPKPEPAQAAVLLDHRDIAGPASQAQGGKNR